MNKRMLIDTTHAEETRVVVLDGNHLEDYDVETSAKKQLKGNIYLAKVIRVEPSLQAAFVEYGGNRHGFLAFSEIHPDYYQIPVADRERLIALQEEEARAEEAREEAEPDDEIDAAPELPHPEPPHPDLLDATNAPEAAESDGAPPVEAHTEDGPAERGQADDDENREPAPETIGGETDSNDDRSSSQQSTRFLRQYKIQEVIRRRQILLIQVVKEERGGKGAALTTYISLAGRFCVLMPNSLRGGGVSRKITSAADRRRLKEITTELEIPRGMAMIIRTAGAQRPRPEIRRDCEYLLRLWDDIREQTLRAMAPALIYEEANLIKRAIRDVYTREVEEIVVDGETGWKAAREFMRNLMPANAQKVRLWRDHAQPLFSYYQVEHHLDGMLQPTVQLRSGGYLVINQTEALVAIDVNSGRSTRERGIEETALRTNLEAADEVARQLRLRDLAGLIVIDFIDMEARKHNVMVERRLKDALKNDRARIQLGTISHFGLMEMSRQRLRPSIAESSFVACQQCAGTGFVRGTDSSALHVLRAIEEEGGKQRAAEILVRVAGSVALYVLNNKRLWLAEIEQRHRMVVRFAADDSLIPPQLKIEMVSPQVPQAAAQPAPEPVLQAATMPVADVAAPRLLPANGVISHSAEETFDPELADIAPDVVEQDNAPAASAPTGSATGSAAEGSDEEHKRRRRRRRRRGGRREDGNGALATDGAGSDSDHDAESPTNAQANAFEAGSDGPGLQPDEAVDGETDASKAHEVPLSEERPASGRRRGRRGGARGRKPTATPDQDTDQPAQAALSQDGYNGPTPADPFGNSPADPFGNIYDIFDVIEQGGERTEPAVALAMPEPEPEPPAPAAIEPTLPLPEAELFAEAAPKPKRLRASPRAKPASDANAEVSNTDAEVKPKTPRKSRAKKPPIEVAAEPVIEAVAAQAPPAATIEAPPAATIEAPPAATIEAPPAATTEAPPAATTEAPEPEREDRLSSVVQPILIDTLEAPAARRTGWWKR